MMKYLIIDVSCTCMSKQMMLPRISKDSEEKEKKISMNKFIIFRQHIEETKISRASIEVALSFFLGNYSSLNTKTLHC